MLLHKSRYDLCRIGISLFGFWPSQPTKLSYLQLNDRVEELRPALSWKTRVAQVKVVKAGKFVGYGCTFRVLRDSQIAVLPVGYFEGYPRIAGRSHSHVILRGQRCPIVGRVCMNMMMIDVSHLKEIKVGEIVTLIGEEDGEIISSHDVAAWSETIHYELVSRINPSLTRKIVP
jgi:alanine racemase